MLALLLSLFRLVWLFGKGHRDVVLENLALRQQLSIYQRKQKRPRLIGGDRWFWMTISVMWKNWRQALLIVHPDTMVRWQRERFRRHWGGLSSKPGRIGRPPIKRDTISFWRTTTGTSWAPMQSSALQKATRPAKTRRESGYSSLI